MLTFTVVLNPTENPFTSQAALATERAEKMNALVAMMEASGDVAAEVPAVAVEAEEDDGKKKKRKRDPNKPKLINAYALFIKESFAGEKEKHDGEDRDAKSVMGNLAHVWKELSDAEKLVWKNKAATANEKAKADKEAELRGETVVESPEPQEEEEEEEEEIVKEEPESPPPEKVKEKPSATSGKSTKKKKKRKKESK